MSGRICAFQEKLGYVRKIFAFHEKLRYVGKNVGISGKIGDLPLPARQQFLKKILILRHRSLRLVIRCPF
jgi:hypothetical protein